MQNISNDYIIHLVYLFRGKGECYCLGHGYCNDITIPKQIEEMADKTITHFSTGDQHCVAVTDDGKVYGWGCNDSGQIGNCEGNIPAELSLLRDQKMYGAICGYQQVSVLFVIMKILFSIFYTG